LASPSLANSPAVVRAPRRMCVAAGFGAGAGSAAGGGGGGAAGAVVAVVEAWRVRQSFRNSRQVWPLVVLAVLAAFHSSPHCFMTLSALAGAEMKKPAASMAARPAAILNLDIRVPPEMSLRPACGMMSPQTLYAFTPLNSA